MRMKTLLDTAIKARAQAYSPYSHFQVGCAIQTAEGHIYSGCNVENASYSLTLCAETSAIANMVTDHKQTITDVVIISNGEDICSPCGACRQRIREFAGPTVNIHMYNHKQECVTKTLEELLPLSFGPDHLEKF